MRIGHFSDLHGSLKTLQCSDEIPDVWVCTGDFFPNKRWPIVREDEIHYQQNWLRRKRGKLVKRLAGKPLLYVGGNHDFINLAESLQEAGYPAHNTTIEGVTIDGIRFAGYREIPIINGVWVGESTCTELSLLTARLFENPPDVVLTHAPPAGILDGTGFDGHFGIGSLANALCYGGHKVRAHLFGHVHEWGGSDFEVMGVHFYNGACGLRFFDI